MKQINLKLPDSLIEAAEKFVENYGYRNIQDLAADAMREKIFEKSEFDETFSREEIDLIDNLIAKSVKKEAIVSEEELNKILLE